MWLESHKFSTGKFTLRESLRLIWCLNPPHCEKLSRLECIVIAVNSSWLQLLFCKGAIKKLFTAFWGLQGMSVWLHWRWNITLIQTNLLWFIQAITQGPSGTYYCLTVNYEIYRRYNWLFKGNKSEKSHWVWLMCGKILRPWSQYIKWVTTFFLIRNKKYF